MLRYFPVLLAAIGLLPAAPGGNPVSWSEIVTQPDYRHALGDGFEVEADGRVRAILLLADGPAVEAHLLSDLGPDIQVHLRFGRLIHGLALSLDAADLPALRAHPAALGVYPDVRVRADLAQSGPLVGAPQVWTLTDGAGQPVTGLGVRVAVVDTGVDYTHPALGGCLGPGCKVVGGYDFVHDDGDPLDDHGHGSHVAGIVAADGLLRGVAPGAEILAYKVLDARGEGYASNVIAALEQAVADGADVINLSLGGPGAPDDPLSLAASGRGGRLHRRRCRGQQRAWSRQRRSADYRPRRHRRGCCRQGRSPGRFQQPGAGPRHPGPQARLDRARRGDQLHCAAEWPVERSGRLAAGQRHQHGRAARPADRHPHLDFAPIPLPAPHR